MLLVLLASCSQIQEDGDLKQNPYILELDQYYPSRGRQINMDSVLKPERKVATAQKIPLEQQVLSPRVPRAFYPTERRSLFIQGTRVNESQMEDPPYVASTGDQLKPSWPSWTAVQTSLDAQYIHSHSIKDIGKGLRSGNIWTLLEDRSGKIWIGTWGGGISVWDGSGFTHFTTKEGLGSNAVVDIIEDQQGQIWIATYGGGVSVWDGSLFTHFNQSNGLLDDDVNFLLEDSKGQIWIATSKGLNKWDGQGFFQYTKAQGISSYAFRGLLEDVEGNIWIATSDAGIMVLNEKEGGPSVTHYNKENGLLDNLIIGFWRTQKGAIFIVTLQGFHSLQADTVNQYDFPIGIARSEYPGIPFHEDEEGRIWIKEQQDITIWDGEKLLQYIKPEDFGEEILWEAIKDQRRRIWLATNGGGLKIINETDIETVALSADLSNQFIRTLYIDHQNRCWYGHATDGISVSNGSQVSNFSTKITPATYDIWAILEDQQGQIWYGGYNGLGVWKESSVEHFNQTNGLQDIFVRCLAEGNNGDIWFGTSGGGVGVWDGEGFRYFTEAEGLSDNNIRSLLRDQKGQIWIGTYKGGINLWRDSSFVHFSTREGLPGNSVFKIVEDLEGRIWLGTDNGLCFWDGKGFFHLPALEGLPHYVESLIVDRDGNVWVGAINGVYRLSWTKDQKNLLSQFYEMPDAEGYETVRSMVIDEQNVLWMSTPSGLSQLNLAGLSQDSLAPSLAIVELKAILDEVDWRQVQSAKENNEQLFSSKLQLPLHRIQFDSVLAQENLPLGPNFPNDFNNLHLRWLATDATPEKLRYSYRLSRKGNKEKWSPLVKRNEIDLADLRPGHYSFEVRAVDGNGLWSETAKYVFRIRPPWWLSQMSYAAYLILAGALLYKLYRFQLKRQLTLAEARRTKELEEVKNRLYVNMTHEFRTPLTIILGIAKQVKTQVQERVADHVEMIQRNGQLLLQLINQMLDLSKLEVGKLSLELVQQDIISFLSYQLESFHSAAENQAIQLHFLSSVEELVMDFDPKRLQQVVFNLLSNALKFTPEGGHIYMQITPIQEGQLEIKVKDTGEGIKQEELERVFDRFYQVNSTDTRKGEGTGIGLALVKELVKLMEGDIKVKSIKGKGTEFFFQLPIRQEAENSVLVELQQPVVLAAQKDQSELFPTELFEAPKVLIIEDNQDVRQYIAICLGSHFQLEFAMDGKEGVQKAYRSIPDVIISDVMMPLLDGFEVCEQLKSDRRTSHIPIIMLTARADQESKLKGLQYGADLYLGKPFDQEELLIQLNNLLLQQKRLKRYYLLSTTQLSSEQSDLQPLESSFVKEVKLAIEKHLGNSSFGVSDLSREVALSPSQLHRKLTALTGLSASKMIRRVRMNEAKRQLQDPSLSISEIAYACGFNDPDYFSKVFKTEFGVIPSVYRKQNRSF